MGVSSGKRRVLDLLSLVVGENSKQKQGSSGDFEPGYKRRAFANRARQLLTLYLTVHGAIATGREPGFEIRCAATTHPVGAKHQLRNGSKSWSELEIAQQLDDLFDADRGICTISSARHRTSRSKEPSNH